MRLERGTTRDIDTDSRLRGNTWLFYIHDDNAEKLEAVEDILRKEWDDECDGCPCYEDGFGSGFWVDIYDVPKFKKDFKAAQKLYKENKNA